MFGRNLWGLGTRGGKFICALRRRVGVPEGDFLIRVAPSKSAKLVPFQAGTNIPGYELRVPYPLPHSSLLNPRKKLLCVRVLSDPPRALATSRDP